MKVSYSSLSLALSFSLSLSDQIRMLIYTGKSTLLNCITGLTDCVGEIFIKKCQVGLEEDIIRHEIGIGVMPQGNSLFPMLTATEHIRLYLAIKGISENSDAHVQRLLDQVGLTHADCNKLSKNLSGGQRRRLQLALAFIGDPFLVILGTQN